MLKVERSGHATWHRKSHLKKLWISPTRETRDLGVRLEHILGRMGLYSDKWKITKLVMKNAGFFSDFILLNWVEEKGWWKYVSHSNAYSFLSPFTVSPVPGNQTWHSDQSCKFIQHQGCCQHFEDSLIIIFVLASASRADGCHADWKGVVVTGGRAWARDSQNRTLEYFHTKQLFLEMFKGLLDTP